MSLFSFLVRLLVIMDVLSRHLDGSLLLSLNQEAVGGYVVKWILVIGFKEGAAALGIALRYEDGLVLIFSPFLLHH